MLVKWLFDKKNEYTKSINKPVSCRLFHIYLHFTFSTFAMILPPPVVHRVYACCVPCCIFYIFFCALSYSAISFYTIFFSSVVCIARWLRYLSLRLPYIYIVFIDPFKSCSHLIAHKIVCVNCVYVIQHRYIHRWMSAFSRSYSLPLLTINVFSL